MTQTVASGQGSNEVFVALALGASDAVAHTGTRDCANRGKQGAK